MVENGQGRSLNILSFRDSICEMGCDFLSLGVLGEVANLSGSINCQGRLSALPAVHTRRAWHMAGVPFPWEHGAQTVLYSSKQLFGKQFLSTCCMPGTAQGPGTWP